MNRFASFVVVAALFVTACGGGIVIQGTPRAVGADAVIDVGGMEGGSRLVALRARHLPPPARIAQGTRYFALWVKKDGHGSRLISIMDYDEGSREGYARGTTPLSSFQVLLTAERGREPREPSEVVIFRQNAS